MTDGSRTGSSSRPCLCFGLVVLSPSAGIVGHGPDRLERRQTDTSEQLYTLKKVGGECRRFQFSRGVGDFTSVEYERAIYSIKKGIVGRLQFSWGGGQ